MLNVVKLGDFTGQKAMELIFQWLIFIFSFFFGAFHEILVLIVSEESIAVENKCGRVFDELEPLY